jgi:hypothetical protein
VPHTLLLFRCPGGQVDGHDAAVLQRSPWPGRRVGHGVMAIARGAPGWTGIGLPGVLVAVLIGMTVPGSPSGLAGPAAEFFRQVMRDSGPVLSGGFWIKANTSRLFGDTWTWG